jgi:hypothetical protein
VLRRSSRSRTNVRAAFGSPDCTPGYYNNEGQGSRIDWFLGYPGGAVAYFQYLEEWRNKGDFAGLEFR